MSRKSSESFREYAQRWRETAAQVTPAMDERKMVNSFFPTLLPFLFTALFSCVDRSFSDLIKKEKMLEDGIRLGKIKAHETPSTGNVYQRSPYDILDEEELPVSAIILGQSLTSRRSPKQRSRPLPTQAERLNPDQPGVEQKSKRVFTPLGYSLSQAFDHLVTGGHLQPILACPIPTNLPKNWDPTARCEFHSGGVGHTTETCFALKHKVQDMIDEGLLNPGAQLESLNIQVNLLQPYDANVITEDGIQFSPALLIGQPGEVIVISANGQDTSPIICAIGDDDPPNRSPRGLPSQPRPQFLIPVATPVLPSSLNLPSTSSQPRNLLTNQKGIPVIPQLALPPDEQPVSRAKFLALKDQVQEMALMIRNIVSVITWEQKIEAHLPSDPVQLPPTPPVPALPTKQQWLKARKSRTFTPLGCTELHAYRLMQTVGHIHPVPARPVPNPRPRGYDPAQKCEYHSGMIGHSTNNCFALKHKLQDLIEAGIFWPTDQEGASNASSS